VLTDAPDVPTLEDERREVRLMTPEHFKAIWAAAGSDWWQAFLATAVSTPFYVKELLRLRWDGIDLDAALATLAPEASPTNQRRRKPKRAALHPVAIKHLRKLAKRAGGVEVFAWEKPPRARNGHVVGPPEKNMLERWAEGDVYGLLKAFRDMQERAAVKLDCDRKHHHTERCWRYGLDDLRVAAVYRRGGELLAALEQTAARTK
ncbi:MAG TPA: hypothetical protein PK867_17465, partial [Pirellulales bacterium]|nr:hypothetical protein [Pirellulales bacterium]